MNNLIGVVVSFGFVGVVLGLSLLLTRFHAEVSRKFVHIAVCHWWFIALAFFDNPLWAAVAPLSFVVVNYLSYRFHLIKSIERQEGKGDLGTVYYAIALLVLSIAAFSTGNLHMATVGILVMGYGDGLAAVVGKALKFVPYKVFGNARSLGGSITMFAVSFAVCAIVLTVTGSPSALLFSLILASVATLVEAVTPWGFDNLSVPILTAMTYFLLSGKG